MLPERTISYITVLPSNKSQLKEFVRRFENELGIEEPLKVAVQLKALEELIDALRKSDKVRKFIMEEIDKYPEKEISYLGANLIKAETGTKYNYKDCHSSTWEDLNRQKDEITEKLKKEEEFLKGLLKSDTEVYDKVTGERIAPPLKTSNSYIKIVLADKETESIDIIEPKFPYGF